MTSWTWHVVHIAEERNKYKTLVRKPQGNSLPWKDKVSKGKVVPVLSTDLCL